MKLLSLDKYYFNRNHYECENHAQTYRRKIILEVKDRSCHSFYLLITSRHPTKSANYLYMKNC